MPEDNLSLDTYSSQSRVKRLIKRLPQRGGRWLVVLTALLVFLQYQLWFADTGLQRTQHLRDQLHKQQQTNQQILLHNHKLKHQIQLWQHSQSRVETLAREELGMVKPDEHYYQF